MLFNDSNWQKKLEHLASAEPGPLDYMIEEEESGSHKETVMGTSKIVVIENEDITKSVVQMPLSLFFVLGLVGKGFSNITHAKVMGLDPEEEYAKIVRQVAPDSAEQLKSLIRFLDTDIGGLLLQIGSEGLSDMQCYERVNALLKAAYEPMQGAEEEVDNG